MYSGVFFLLFPPSTHFYLPLFPAGIKPSTRSSLRTSVASMLPWGLQGFSCLKSAVYTGTVWKQHRAPGTPPPTRFHALKPIKPPLSFSFSLDSAFALLFSLFVAPPSPGHWCQTDLLSAGACFCSCADEQMNARVGVSGSVLLFLLTLFHTRRVNVCLSPCNVHSFTSIPYSINKHLFNCGRKDKWKFRKS